MESKSLNSIKNLIPQEVEIVCHQLMKAGFDAYIVGGCVRDIYQGISPHDWDVTTNAQPEQIQEIFPDSVYENNFGTVGVKTGSANQQYAIIEVTTYRIEDTYSDNRHPDTVSFAKTVEEDLARRDFTMNAMALAGSGDTQEIIDPFGGERDINKKIVRAVGDPRERFTEDALRMMRAIRLACQLDFEIEKGTLDAIFEVGELLKKISWERIRDEFTKIIMTPRAGWGMELLRDTGLLRYIMPELLEGVGVDQNKHHIYTVWEHNKRALEYTVEKEYDLEIRLAALLHDVGKPATKRGNGKDSTFHGHEVVGGRMTKNILERMKFSKKIVDHVTHLVRNHLFYYNVGEVTEAGVRRFLSRVGFEYVDDLIKVREADRIGSGTPKAVPYKLRHLLFMIDKVRRDPISPKMLALNGNELMKELKLTPSPRVGWILAILLEDVIEDPTRNVKEDLLQRAGKLSEQSDVVLIEKMKQSKERAEEFESGVEQEIKRKFKV